MGGDKGGSADSSGMMEALASAQASQQAYALGEQQLQWTQQVWNQEQPLMDASEQQQMALASQEQQSLEQSDRESAQQYQEYEDTYAPLEQSYATEAENWDSPAAIAQARGQAMGDVAEQGQAGVNTAAETLRSYGINPGSGRYASLYTGTQPMLAASEAGAGTTAAQNLRLQQMGLEAGAINTGRGLVNDTSTLANTGTGAANSAEGAASGAAKTADSNLSTGSTAMTNPSQWFNTGNQAMGVYTGAVNGYNDAQAAFNQAGASETSGLFGAAGTILGKFLAKGGPATGYADGGGVNPGLPPTPYTGMGGGMTGVPGAPVMPPTYPAGYANGGPGRPGIPTNSSLPSDATPGGTVPTHASPSHGVVTDDVPAMLTSNEFVIPKDVAIWKGHQHFAKQIDQARREQQEFSQRDDIGGEPTSAIPQRPTFVSRPGQPALPPSASHAQSRQPQPNAPMHSPHSFLPGAHAPGIPGAYSHSSPRAPTGRGALPIIPVRRFG